MFISPNSFLTDRSERFYEQNSSWHNLFLTQVTLRVEESLFELLYSKETGSPNASVRIMVAMMILKEDYCYWSITDKNIFKKINGLNKKCTRTSCQGVGKPKPLKYELAGT